MQNQRDKLDEWAAWAQNVLESSRHNLLDHPSTVPKCLPYQHGLQSCAVNFPYWLALPNGLQYEQCELVLSTYIQKYPDVNVSALERDPYDTYGAGSSIYSMLDSLSTWGEALEPASNTSSDPTDVAGVAQALRPDAHTLTSADDKPTATKVTSSILSSSFLPVSNMTVTPVPTSSHSPIFESYTMIPSLNDSSKRTESHNLKLFLFGILLGLLTYGLGYSRKVVSSTLCGWLNDLREIFSMWYTGSTDSVLEGTWVVWNDSEKVESPSPNLKYVEPVYTQVSLLDPTVSIADATDV